MSHKRLRKKLKEHGYKNETIKKIIDFYTKRARLGSKPSIFAVIEPTSIELRPLTTIPQFLTRSCVEGKLGF